MKTDEKFIEDMRRALDPNLSDIERLLRLVRAGDVVHVNAQPDLDEPDEPDPPDAETFAARKAQAMGKIIAAGRGHLIK